MSEHTLVLVVQPPNGQKSYSNIHVLLLTPYTYDRVHQGKFSIFRKSITQFWIFWKKIQNKWSGKLAKFEKTSKQDQNHKIFIITLTEKLVWQIIGICCTSLHNTHEHSVHLCFVIFCSFPVWVWIFFDKKAYFHANWLYIIHILLNSVKPTIFGNFSVSSVLCHYCSYLSWETSQQNFLWKFWFTMAFPNF